ncbi:hypothetical protein J1614_005825 [Plenodomus biglobosus]|nr:hypothetical protein J1614_005825 [Plenodomus biglobosus]
MRSLKLSSTPNFRHSFRRLSICDFNFQQRPTILARSMMAPQSLIRHIFRDLQPRIDQMRSPSKQDAYPARPAAAITQADTVSSSSDHRPLAASTPLTASAPQIPHLAILEDIAEEPSAETVTENCAPRDDDEFNSCDFMEYTTRELLDTSVFEAKLALQSHLNSLATTIALLEALDGFSQTITVMKSDMLTTQQECKAKLKMMQSVEDAAYAKDNDSDGDSIGGSEGRN